MFVAGTVVKPQHLWYSNSAIHRATGSLVTGHSQNAGMNVPQRPFPHSQLQGHFSSETVEQWNRTSQTQGMAGNREACDFVNSAVKPFSYGSTNVPGIFDRNRQVTAQ